MDLEELRIQIDQADRDILDAFERRMVISKKIGEWKKLQGMEVLDTSRENEKTEALMKLAGDESRQYIGELYKTIFEISRKHQNKKFYGVLGKSLPHTYSPNIHNLLTSDYTYTVIEREEDQLDDLFGSNAYGGFNVTVPYKIEAAKRCTGLSPEARDTGAVNTVVFRNGEIIGYNTDIYGFGYMLRRSGIDPAGKDCLILGHGGASVAVEYCLSKAGAKSITFVSRREDINYDNVYEKASGSQIIINCTPVGMYPDIDGQVIDLAGFPKAEAFADLIYNPSRTRLIMQAERLGLKVAGGLSMLVAQALKASLIFRDLLPDNEDPSEEDEKIADAVCDTLSKRMRNIVLIGMPGCGKTTLAEELAKITGRKMIDLDIEYAGEFGEKPSDTIKREGEDSFRHNETVLAKRILPKSGLIISCGGGLVTREDNIFPMRCNSVVIYIERPLDVLASDDRPLTAQKGVAALYGERRELYENYCDIKITVGKKANKKEFLSEAVTALKKEGII
ncbi:MAG: chorismate mutase [Clostridiales bacterium]|nr:chorismate mutase [Clostridiales bacterium]